MTKIPTAASGNLTSCTRLIAALLFFLLPGFSVQAQNGAYDFRNIVPPSPTAASLGKFGEIPVGLYTGIPNISIPLYEIKDGPLNLPISLSYHAGGVRVEEVASSVGIGWALNAGGIVGRQVRGMADEFRGWITSNESRIETILQSGNQGSIYSMTQSLKNRTKDGEADIFHYNFGGKSGKFFFDQAGTIHNYPANGLLIAPIGGTFNTGTGWKITAEDGTVYEFNKGEHSISNSCGSEGLETHTSWFLTKIKSADGSGEINLTYESFITNIQITPEETKYFVDPTSTNHFFYHSSPCTGTYTNYTCRVTRIDFSGGYVKFNYNTNRLDMLDGTDKQLDQIAIYTADNQLLKKFDFGYAYFGASAQSYLEKRLKLTSITEKSITGTKPPYLFTYNESVQHLHMNSYSKDYWGYYNGKSNPSLIPNFWYYESGNSRYITGGGDRSADPNFAQAFILKKIQYPTGGETAFTYESNTVADSRLQPPLSNTHVLSANVPYSSISNPYISDEFVIPSQGAMASFTISGLNPPPRPGCDIFRAYLVKDNVILGDITDGSYGPVNISGGTYKIRIEWDCWEGNLNYTYIVRAQIPNPAVAGETPAGGLRIKEMEHRPGNGGQPVLKKYRYGTENDPTISSGVMVNFPNYGYRATAEGWVLPPGGSCPNGTNPGTASYVYESALVVQSSTNYPMATTIGSYIGYSYVVEDMGTGGEIRHRYKAYEQPQGAFPFVPFEMFDWKRGSELSTDYMARKNGQLVKAKTIQNYFTAVNKATVKGYRISRDHRVSPTCNPSAPPSEPFVSYDVIPQFYALTDVTERLYDQTDETKYTETNTNYTYNTNHYQLAQVRRSASSSSANPAVVNETVTNKKYAQDYSFTGTPSGAQAAGIKTLQNLHIVDLPVEEYSYLQNRNTTDQQVSNQQVVSGTITIPKVDKPYPDQIYRLETDAPILLSTFGSGSTVSNNAFVFNPNSSVNAAYKPAISFTSYDDKGNLLQQQKTDGFPTAYLWGYNKQYLIAEVKNASQADIAHTSFESEGAGSWTIGSAARLAGDAYTGSQYYSLSGGNTLSKTGLTSTKKYIVSYWSKNPTTPYAINGTVGTALKFQANNGWTYYEHEVTGQTTVSVTGTGLIDEVRLYPKGALMTTYTHDPLKGITSMTDIKNQTTRYDYDDFQRLKNAKDQKGSIVKNYEYNYKK